MESVIKILFLSIILALIDGMNGEASVKISDISKNQTLNNSNVIKFDKTLNKSVDLETSDQQFSYNYAKEDHTPYGDSNYPINGKSYLKEVHYFHDKQIGYERKHDWNSDNDEEIASKKVKKDLYNKRNYGKNYDPNDMIEIKKWDDEEPNIHTNNYNNNYNQANSGNYNNLDDSKNKIKLYSSINNNNNNQNYKSDGNKDKNNYSHRKYGTEESAEERGRDLSGYDEHNQKWFTNKGDKVQSGSVANEVKDEDNYNNFNSPKFIVNFHNFRPWNKIMRSRRHEDNGYDTDKISDNFQDNYEIYSNSRSSKQDRGTDGGRTDRFNYEPKLLTNFNIETRDQNKDNYNNNNIENYNKNKIYSNDRVMRYKTTDFKEAVKKLKSRPKNARYHYEKRVEPQVYSPRPKDDVYGNGYESGDRDGEYPPVKNEMSREFIEMPFDTFNTGWSSVQKPRRKKTNRKQPKAVPTVRQYRYGF